MTFARGWLTTARAASCLHGPAGVHRRTGGTLASGTCTDAAGNSSGVNQPQVKVDTVLPTVAVTGVANGQIYTLGAVPAAACSTTDPLSGVDAAATLAVTGGVPPGVGTFTATCSGATDKAGNASLPVSVSYQVQFAPVGTSCLGTPAHQVLQPVNADGTSVFKQKSTVPVKFRVCDANGVSIGTNVVSTFFLVEVLNGTVVENPNEQPVESTTPDTAFRFDPTGQQWIFNTNTKGLAGAPDVSLSDHPDRHHDDRLLLRVEVAWAHPRAGRLPRRRSAAVQPSAARLPPCPHGRLAGRWWPPSRWRPRCWPACSGRPACSSSSS